MITGLLYYYLKKLDEIRFPLTADQASNLDILGLEYISATAFAQIGEDVIPSKLKDLFISSYGSFLVENNLRHTADFWNVLTSPSRSSLKISLKPRSEFQRIICGWGDNEYDFRELESVVEQGELSSREDDLALLYGLKILKQFSMDRDDIDLPTAEHTFDDRKPDKVIYSTKPQILVVTSDELAPLFVNVGCEAITKINDSTKMTSDVQDVIASEPSIKVVLIEGEHNEDLIKQLRKSLRGDILISGLSLPTHQTLESNQKTYFDQIARSTLGVRLD